MKFYFFWVGDFFIIMVILDWEMIKVSVFFGNFKCLLLAVKVVSSGATL